MATIATTTDQSADVFALLRELTRQQLTWSLEGTFRAEEVVRRVAAAYSAHVEVAFLADAAVLTVGDRTASFSRAPIVPPLDQVSDFKRLLNEIDEGALSAREAATRLAALERRPPVFRRVLRPDPRVARAARLRELARRPLDPRLPGLGDMISLMTALAAGMLVGAAAVGSAVR